MMDIWFKLMLFIDSIIYRFVTLVYQVFLVLANGRMAESDSITQLMDRLQILMGVVMLFIVTYALLRALINPDNLTKGEYAITSVLKNIIISLALLALMPTIFNLAYEFQDVVINQDNLIGAVILGTKHTPGISNDDMALHEAKSQDGRMMALETYRVFFRPKGVHLSGSEPGVAGFDDPRIVSVTCSQFFGTDRLICQQAPYVGFDEQISLDRAFDFIKTTGDFGKLSAFIPQIGEKIEYNFFISAVCGILLLYLITSFALDMGVRYVKLVFYQLIAPIPILIRIVPKQDKIFNNWLKVTGTVFVEVFLRLIVINLAVFLIANYQNFFGVLFKNFTSGEPLTVALLANTIMILGILAFAKQAPKLIGDVFGFDSANMKLGIKSKIDESMSGLGYGAAGLIGGGVLGAAINGFNGKGIRRALGGAVSGGLKGAQGGWNAKTAKEFRSNTREGAKNAFDEANARALYRESHGGTIGGEIKGRFSDFYKDVKGVATGKKQYYDDNPISEVDYLNDALAKQDNLEKIFETDKYYASMKAEKDRLKSLLEMYGADHLDQTTGKAVGEMYDIADKKVSASQAASIRKNQAAATYHATEFLEQLLESPKYAEKAGLDKNAITKMYADIKSKDLSTDDLVKMITEQNIYVEGNQNVENTNASDGLLDVGKTFKSERTLVTGSVEYSEQLKQREEASKKAGGNSDS